MNEVLRITYEYRAFLIEGESGEGSGNSRLKRNIKC
jgi:hypothetical protein